MILSNGAINALRSVHDSALSDTCVRLVHSAGSGDYGYGAASYTTGDTVTCLVIALSQRELMGSTQVRAGDVRIRMSLGTPLNNLDRLQVTRLHGDALPSAQTYEIIEGPQTTHTGVWVIGRLVTDGSES